MFECDLWPSWSCSSLRPLLIPALCFFFFFAHLALVTAQKHKKMPRWARREYPLLAGLSAAGYGSGEAQPTPCPLVSDGEEPTQGTAVRRNRSKFWRPATSEDFSGWTRLARIPVVHAPCGESLLLQLLNHSRGVALVCQGNNLAEHPGRNASDSPVELLRRQIPRCEKAIT